MEYSGRQDVERFIIEEIDSVPHLEALLLLWNRRPRQWPVEDVAQMLYVPPQTARKLLQELAQRGLISAVPGVQDCYACSSNSEQDTFLQAVDATYRRELVRITNLIHSKAPAAVREFARAFRFTKEGK